jgi:hypothetical protein
MQCPNPDHPRNAGGVGSQLDHRAEQQQKGFETTEIQKHDGTGFLKFSS